MSTTESKSPGLLLPARKPFVRRSGPSLVLVVLLLCAIRPDTAAATPESIPRPHAATEDDQRVLRSPAERGFAAHLWRRFGPVTRRPQLDSAGVQPDDSLEALQERGLAPSEAMLAPRYFDNQTVTHDTAAGPRGDGVRNTTPERFGDWQQAAMNSGAGAGTVAAGSGPGITVIVVAVASFIVLIGAFLMPR